jgi:hypothetical protein
MNRLWAPWNTVLGHTLPDRCRSQVVMMLALITATAKHGMATQGDVPWLYAPKTMTGRCQSSMTASTSWMGMAATAGNGHSR